ncbi:transcriptional adapter 3 [Drosophila grimshawi]|uniref:GH12450 n=1 Tax=Drosophila grimshawi TaxID=7222 RepID=B4JJ95_DROGR|nr:transcriptional adapter 3 [Drosophila grimshawi]EDV99647.1 GH12450 [Drosophila grimshawi]
MSTNLKNLKMGHFASGGGSGGGFGISAGKLIAPHHNTNGCMGGNAGGSGSGGGASTTNAATTSTSSSSNNASSSASGSGNKSASSHGSTDATEVFAMPSGTVIPIIRSRDVPKQLPTLAAALQRGADEHLAAEDLDAVQLELELMLSNVALRARVLKSEYDSLDKDEKRQDRRKLDRVPPGSPPTNGLLNGLLGINNAAGSSSGAGGGGGGVGSPATAAKRKMREEPTGVRKKHSSMTILKQQQQQGGGGSLAKQLAKNSPLAVHTDDSSMDYVSLPNSNSQQQQQLPQQQHQLPQQQQQQQLPKLALPKNDMPNKFWLSVEPYCMPLTNEDLRLIDDLLEQYRGPLVPPVPSLGPHYSTVWAQEDMKALQPGGARQKSQNVSAMLKKADSMLEESITGPLTQRLVSALMDESLPSEAAAVGEHSSNSSSNNENTHSQSQSSSTQSNGVGSKATVAAAAAASGNFRSLSMLKHGVGIEQRLRKELIESGLIEANELAKHEDVDEVLLEIKRVTAEISAVAQFNSDELKRLRSAASDEIKRIELKRKLDTIDQEILECYKRMLQYRAKRKGHTAEERQEIMRLTSEQRALAEQLERMQLMGAGNCKL